jgi:hypothetical protein
MSTPFLHRRDFIGGSIAVAALSVAASADVDQPDICIYGGTASGVMAAVTAAKQ